MTSQRTAGQRGALFSPASATFTLTPTLAVFPLLRIPLGIWPRALHPPGDDSHLRMRVRACTSNAISTRPLSLHRLFYSTCRLHANFRTDGWRRKTRSDDLLAEKSLSTNSGRVRGVKYIRSRAQKQGTVEGKKEGKYSR